MKRKMLAVFLIMVMVISLCIAGCGKKRDNPTVTDDSKKTNEETSTTIDEPVSDTPETTTPEPATPEPATPEPTTPIPTEPESKPVTVYSLLMSEPVNPKKSGYSELDGLIDKLFSEILTEDMNNYAKVWTCYLYLVDKITYNRGMDANTGAYSSSDVNTTPKEVLWATDLLNSGQGCCYNYSAAFMFIMRALGYDAHLVTGNVPSYGGGVTPHCWLYVNLNGTRYSFDPDLDMNFYKRGENEEKSIWFGRRLDDLGYFYKAETYHEI